MIRSHNTSKRERLYMKKPRLLDLHVQSLKKADVEHGQQTAWRFHGPRQLDMEKNNKMEIKCLI